MHTYMHTYIHAYIHIQIELMKICRVVDYSVFLAMAEHSAFLDGWSRHNLLHTIVSANQNCLLRLHTSNVHTQ